MPMPDPTAPRLERADAPRAGTIVLDLGGELDLAVSPRLRQLFEEVAAEQPELVVADIAGVGFMDSTVLRELLRAHRRFEAGGGRLIVAGVQPAVQRLLELTGTTGVFTLAPSRDAALDPPTSPS